MSNDSFSLVNSNKIIIAGPCALESRSQLRACIDTLLPLGIKYIRASLWKPRTLPGWEGLGATGLPILLEETLSRGAIPATEILNSEHAQIIVNGLKPYGENGKMIVWIGARNQNHLEQRKIAQILASGPNSIKLLFKNQMWEDEKHWLGIYEHLKLAGFPKERMLFCHRGFSPGKMPNPENYRNLPDFDMAMRIKGLTNGSMILDPSHIGGTKENVLKVLSLAKSYQFDGYLIEVHNEPDTAKTDGVQQLSFKDFIDILKLIS